MNGPVTNGFAPWQQRAYAAALNAFDNDRLAHALLLCGPERLGKRAVAVALAKRLLCATPRADRMACGECRGCRFFVAGSHADFLDITFEENEKTKKMRGEIVIEQIRRLGAWFALTPQLGRAQVAIIEPADAINFNASNALLKTLEEPSRDRYLILVSAHPAQLSATIRSRCQRLEFPLPARAEASAWLATQGHTGAAAEQTLDAARGHPGLAAEWLVIDALKLRRQVQGDLESLAAGKLSALETARLWVADGHAALRLRFAAEFALDLTAAQTGARPIGKTSLTVRADFPKLSAWFDTANRTRDLLRTPIRADLAVAALLQDWRIACRG